MQKYIGDKLIDEEYLNENEDVIFVFGDNLQGTGLGGAAKLRYHPQSYGFITKKYPSNASNSFYKPSQYKEIFEKELSKLVNCIESNKKYRFFITPLGSGLANKYNIWETVIKNGLTVLEKYDNVIFLYDKD
jgi:hypothetical protein